MNTLVQNLLVALFAVNALFWGLMPHKVHCDLVSTVSKTCPPHSVHIVMGLVAFFLAVVTAQWDYLTKK